MGTWYGPTITATTYESAAALFEKITIAAGGNLTKLSVWIEDKYAANIKLALYDSTGDTRLSVGGEILNANIVNGAWNDFTLVTPIEVTDSQVVLCGFLMSGQVEVGLGAAVANYGYYQFGIAYADFPPASLSENMSDNHNGLRVYVEEGGASAALTGTAMDSIDEADIVAGGKTIIITLTGDTWIPE